MSAPSKLVVGLGNPGDKYAGTRHNLGWLVVQRLGELLKAEPTQSAGVGHPSEQSRAGAVLLVRPTTFMNKSGAEVKRVMGFYKVPPAGLLVITDDLDVPFGEHKLQPSGGSAGHQGMESIVQQLGTSDFARLRVGIGRPPAEIDPADFVLQRFTPAEEAELTTVVEAAAQAAKEWLGE